VDAERCFDLRADDIRALQGKQRLGVALRFDDILESHITSGAVRADIDLLIIGTPEAILQASTDVTICLAVPVSKSGVAVLERIDRRTWFLVSKWPLPRIPCCLQPQYRGFPLQPCSTLQPPS